MRYRQNILILAFFIVVFLSVWNVLVNAQQGAGLFFEPASQGIELDKELKISLMLNSQVPVNAAQAIIKFPRDKVEVIDVSQEDSVFTLWALVFGLLDRRWIPIVSFGA